MRGSAGIGLDQVLHARHGIEQEMRLDLRLHGREPRLGHLLLQPRLFHFGVRQRGAHFRRALARDHHGSEQ